MVQEVLTHFLSSLLYKLGQDFLDRQYLFEYGSRVPTEGLQVENVVVVLEAGVARHPVSSPVPIIDHTNPVF